MKGFGKCLRADLRVVRGEILTAYMTVVLFSFLGVNPLLSPALISSEPGVSEPLSFGRLWEARYLLAIPAAVIIGYCFFRMFKRLFYTAMFTDGAALYKMLPVSEKSAAMSKFVAAGTALTGQQFILLGLKWYRLRSRLTEFSSHEFQMRALRNYNGFMEALGGELLKQAASSFAFAAMIFAAIAVCCIAKKNHSGRGFWAVLVIVGANFAVIKGTEAIGVAFELGAGPSCAVCAAIWLIITLCCMGIVMERVMKIRR